jgi:hypothetical protein
MSANGMIDVVAQRGQMARTLFHVFVSVFSVSAGFAFLALGIVFIWPERAENFPQFGRLVWALWGVVLAEVAGGIFALWKNLFQLSSEGEAVTARNIAAEIVDGLESSGDISDDKANALRTEYQLLSRSPRPVKRRRRAGA